jgi:hypothetical protein
MEIALLQLAAGTVSSVIFAASNLSMLTKAVKTKSLESYSLSQIALSNLGNLIYWLYVVSLSFGPVWFLHGFFTITTGLMLLFYLRYETCLSVVHLFKSMICVTRDERKYDDDDGFGSLDRRGGRRLCAGLAATPSVAS